MRKSVVGAGLFFGFLFILMLSRPEFHGGIESWLLYGMLPLLMVGSWMLFSDSMDASAGFVIYSPIRHFREIRRGVRKMEREVHAKEEASREEEV